MDQEQHCCFLPKRALLRVFGLAVGRVQCQPTPSSIQLECNKMAASILDSFGDRKRIFLTQTTQAKDHTHKNARFC